MIAITIPTILMGCSCLVFTMSTVAKGAELPDTVPPHDTVARASRFYQLAVDYFLTSSFCANPRDGKIWCYFAPPSSVPMHEMCRGADSLRLELTKDWTSTRELLMSPVSTAPGFTWPNVVRAPIERSICDKAAYRYYRRDRTWVDVRGAREIINLVVEWLDNEL